MNKLILFFIAVGVAFSVHAQQAGYLLSDEGGTASPSGSRTILCPEGTIYSHQVNYNNAVSSQEGHFIFCDRIETAPGSPISQIVFFGVVTGTPSRSFSIYFYHDNGGVPGTLFASYTSYIPAVSTGEYLFNKEAFSYTFTFPGALPINAGDWISIAAANVDMWYWLTGSGGDGCYFNNYVGPLCDIGDLAFCLQGGPGARTPVAPWALGIGIALIAAAVILRYRRIV